VHSACLKAFETGSDVFDFHGLKDRDFKSMLEPAPEQIEVLFA
jgi:hypothetical protein